MTTKQKILTYLDRGPEDMTVDQAIDQLQILRDIDESWQQMLAGDVMDHAEFMAELFPKHE